MADVQPTPTTGASHDAPAWQWLTRERLLTPEQQARAWLAPRLQCRPEAVSVQRSVHGRPQLSGPHATHDTSWSHSGDGLLITLARGVVVGIDLEFERPRRQVVALAQRYFHPAEAAWIAGQAEQSARQSAFIRLWCAKEAVLKAHGRGLAFGLDRLCFSDVDGNLQLLACDPALGDAPRWHLRELVPHAGYRAALAWYPGILPA